MAQDKLGNEDDEGTGLLAECGFDVEEKRDDLGSLSNVLLVCRKRVDVAPASAETPGETVSR